MRRTQINRTSSFSRRTGRLPAQSAKRKKLMGQRRRMLAEFFSDMCVASSFFPPVCGGAMDPHEPLTRGRGGSIVDPENLMWICRNHHDYFHAHPMEAEAFGFMLPSRPQPPLPYQRGRDT